MKKSIFLPMFITIGLLSFRPLDAANSAKCSKLQSYVLAGKNKLYSPESKNAAFMDAIHIERGFKTLLFGDRMDYGAAQFWLDHGVEVSQELKDNKLREALCFRTCAGIEFWLENGANLMSLSKETRQNGLNRGATWVELNDDGVLEINIVNGMTGHLAFINLPGEDSNEKIKKVLNSYSFNAIIKNPFLNLACQILT